MPKLPNIPTTLQEIHDADLLDRAFEPEAQGERTPLELELAWRLAAVLHEVDAERGRHQRELAALWSACSGRCVPQPAQLL